MEPARVDKPYPVISRTLSTTQSPRQESGTIPFPVEVKNILGETLPRGVVNIRDTEHFSRMGIRFGISIVSPFLGDRED